MKALKRAEFFGKVLFAIMVPVIFINPVSMIAVKGFFPSFLTESTKEYISFLWMALSYDVAVIAANAIFVIACRKKEEAVWRRRSEAA